jgi:hypothetical protein
MINYVACPLLLNWTPKMFKPEICRAKMMASKLIDIAKTVNWLLMIFLLTSNQTLELEEEELHQSWIASCFKSVDC